MNIKGEASKDIRDDLRSRKIKGQSINYMLTLEKAKNKVEEHMYAAISRYYLIEGDYIKRPAITENFYRLAEIFKTVNSDKQMEFIVSYFDLTMRMAYHLKDLKSKEKSKDELSETEKNDLRILELVYSDEIKIQDFFTLSYFYTPNPIGFSQTKKAKAPGQYMQALLGVTRESVSLSYNKKALQIIYKYFKSEVDSHLSNEEIDVMITNIFKVLQPDPFVRASE